MIKGFICMCTEINEMFAVYTKLMIGDVINELTLSRVLNTQNSQVNTTKASLCKTGKTIYCYCSGKGCKYMYYNDCFIYIVTIEAC